MNTRNSTLISIALLIAAAPGALTGCFRECTDTSTEQYCTCDFDNESTRCQDSSSSTSSSGLTCSGLQPNAEARSWTVTVVDNVSRCAWTQNAYANSQTEANNCVDTAAVSVYGGNQLCDYFFARTCLDYDCGHEGIVGRTQAEAQTCFEYMYPSCTIIDVTEEARPAGGCYGYTQGASFWPCP